MVFATQGVLEVEERERSKDKGGRGEDVWLQELQDQIRNGRLSEDNWHFLHGRPTLVPGTWARGTAQCGNEACIALAEVRAASGAHSEAKLTRPHKRARNKNIQDHILENECSRCKHAREQRTRVATRRHDTPFENPPFDGATAIFPTNDVKYDTNKRRAQLFAARRRLGIVYSIAKDTPSQTVLRERPGLWADKVKWLQRHDREAGDLYGMLPLIADMPVALTAHVDRNPDKQLLRGKVGYIHSWVWDEKETSVMVDGVRSLVLLPKVVFVRFPDASWTLPGLSEKGVYPIVPRKGSWFLDHGRPHPVLRVTRRQLPLAPAFAITAHAAQGQTLKAAIIDLHIGRDTSPIAAYVALTRVARISDLLIYRDFPLDSFTKGPPEGPELLLTTLRGEHVDWKAVEDKHTPSNKCTGCDRTVFRQEFAPSQWNRKDGKHFCLECVATKRAAGIPLECLGPCGQWKQESDFTKINVGRRTHRICIDCARNGVTRQHCLLAA